MIIAVCIVILVALGLWRWFSEGYCFKDFIYVLFSSAVVFGYVMCSAIVL